MVNEGNLSDEALNDRLQQLVREAQNYPPRSIQRRLALNKLMKAIYQSGKISKQTSWAGLANYQDLYNEALQKTLLEICDRIETYRPKHPVMAWVNKTFRWRFSDVVEEHQKGGITYIPKSQKIPQLIDIDTQQPEYSSEIISESEELRKAIAKDPEKFLENETMTSNPHINLKIILLMIISGMKWREISEELGIPLATASSFYQRRFPRVIAYLQQYLSS